jgi:hypothetical protein
MSLESAKSTLHNLNAKVDAGDVEGGKAILAEMKVSTSKRRNRNPFKSVLSTLGIVYEKDRDTI